MFTKTLATDSPLPTGAVTVLNAGNHPRTVLTVETTEMTCLMSSTLMSPQCENAARALAAKLAASLRLLFHSSRSMYMHARIASAARAWLPTTVVNRLRYSWKDADAAPCQPASRSETVFARANVLLPSKSMLSWSSSDVLPCEESCSSAMRIWSASAWKSAGSGMPR